MNSHKNFMQKAIAVAKESGEKYGHRIGAILVKDDQVVATAPSVDNNFHAESNAIHLTLKKFNLTQLTGFTLYTTQEPCSMCLQSKKHKTYLFEHISWAIKDFFVCDVTKATS